MKRITLILATNLVLQSVYLNTGYKSKLPCLQLDVQRHSNFPMCMSQWATRRAIPNACVNDSRLQTPIHTAWSKLGTLIDPENKPGSCGNTFRNFRAFVQPLYNFFKIADGVLSKFHDADAFDAAKYLYYEALEVQVLIDLKKKPSASPVAAGVAVDDGAELTDDWAAARWLVLQRVGVLVQLVGTPQYLPDPCVVEWKKVTKGDDQLLPQREVEMALITATQGLK